MRGKGIQFIRDNIKSITQQTYPHIEIVISDHSVNDDIENWVGSIANDVRSKKIAIEYYRLEDKRGSASANLNNAIRMATGSIIKPIFQDDFLVRDDAIADVVEAFAKNPDANWACQGFVHTDEGTSRYYGEQVPRFTPLLLIGSNSIGCPSVIAFKNTSDQVFCDTNLIWLMDCELYWNLYIHFGKPVIIDKIGVGIRIWDKSVTNDVSEIIKLGEEAYVLRKYNETKESLIKK